MRITGLKTFVADVSPESIDALAEVRAKSPVPIAAGERWYEPTRFLEALSKKAVDILQPDVSHAGGLAETKRVAHLAHLHLIPVAPHNPVGSGDERDDAAHGSRHPEFLRVRNRQRRCPMAQGAW